MWDYFISHASEDKLAIAEPLAKYLAQADFKVWYDDFSLTLGDSLLSSINRGLADSRFGIAVLSENFFNNKWPKNELAGLVATEHDRKKILPVWHNITASAVAKYAPILADRVAINSAKGLQAVGKAIVAASYPKRMKRLPLQVGPKSSTDATTFHENARNTYRTLLESGASVSDLRAFLSVNHSLVVEGWRPALIPAFVLPEGLDFDFAVLHSDGITGPITLELIILSSLDRTMIGSTLTKLAEQLGPKCGRPVKPYNYGSGTLVGEFPALDRIGEAMRKLAHSDNVHFERSDWWILELRVISGRRRGVTPEQSELPNVLREMHVVVASYDRLADDERPSYMF